MHITTAYLVSTSNTLPSLLIDANPASLLSETNSIIQTSYRLLKTAEGLTLGYRLIKDFSLGT